MTKQIKSALDKVSKEINDVSVENTEANTVLIEQSEAPSRRKLITAVAGLGLVSTLPKEWSKPLINSVLVPAHAQTSPEVPEVPEVPDGCSGFETEPIAEPIVITVSATQIIGPIIIERTDPLAFDGFQESETTTSCSATDNFSEEITFDGTIDSANNEITGNFILRQFCGDALVCEQITTYTASQTPAVAGDDLGTYNGTASGTLRCCIDFL